MQLRIRHTKEADIDRVMEVIAAARRFMRLTGNVEQWPEGCPSRATIEGDVARGNSYVCESEDGHIAATFCFAPSPDPTYAVIYEGQWLNDEPYHVIHRMASDGSVSGIGGEIIEWCKLRDGSLRVDTHAANRVMQALAERHGFRRCGIILLADGSPRIAYQLTSRKQG